MGYMSDYHNPPPPPPMSADNEGPSLELCAAFKNNLRDLYHLELDEITDGIYVGSISSEYGDVVGSGRRLRRALS